MKALLLLVLPLLAPDAEATRIAVRTVACPVGTGPVRIYDKLSADTFGGFDSDLASYSTQAQYREFAISTCVDNLFSLYGVDMERLPLDSATKDRLLARLSEVTKTLPPPEQLAIWDRYRIAAEMYRVLGRDAIFIGDLLHRASWTARDKVVGIYEGLDGPQEARALLDAGKGELSKPLNPHQRKIVLHNLARVAHRGGWGEERDQLLDQFEATGQLSPEEKAVLDEFRRITREVEPKLQDEAIASFKAGLLLPGNSTEEKARVSYLLGDLLRRRGRYADALSMLARVMSEPEAPAELRELAAFLVKDISGRHPEARSPR